MVNRELEAVIAHGINAEDVEKLEDAGMHNTTGLMMPRMNLTGTNGLSAAKVDQICEAAEKMVLHTSMRGGNGNVAIIDTEGTFRADQIVPIAERFDMDPRAVLDKD